jgi:DNA-binding NarL/FixJ family response regulator
MTRVSLIEDDVKLRGLFATWLKEEPGVRLVSEFGDAETALASLPQQPPDVVLVDINLPGIDGVECVRLLKPVIPGTQFMMVTVYEDAKRIVGALAAGATGYLLKRAKREELLTAIQDVQRGGSPMTSSIARKVVQSFQQAPATTAADAIQLAPREQEVLNLIARGYVTKEIADRLQVGIPTVKTYIRRIYEKLHVRSRGEAVAKYLGH